MPIDRDIDDRLRALRHDFGDRLDRLDQRVRALRSDAFIDEFSPGGKDDPAQYDYLDFLEIAVPANPDAGWRRVFANTATNKMSVRTSGGTTINLEYGDAEAIAAVEGEATLDLTGEVTIASGKSLTLKTDGSTGGAKFGASGDVILYRGAANRLDLGTGDSLEIVSGNVNVGGNITLTGTVDGVDIAARDHAKYTDAEAITAVEGEATLNLGGAVDITGILTIDVINEKTGAAGVTIDGLLVKDKTLVSPWATLTIAAGQVTRTQLFHEISGQGAAADDLVGIAGGEDGMMLMIHPTSDAVTITVKHNDVGGESSNGTRVFFSDNADKELNDIDDLLVLVYDSGLDGGNGAWIGLIPLTTGTAHDVLDGSTHSDTLADTVTRGSLIVGNATPKWDELVIGAANTVLSSDGTDPSWTGSPSLSGTLSVDTIAELTVGAGVTVDGLLIKDEYLEFDEGAAPGAGAAGKLRVFAKSTDAWLHMQNDGGTDIPISGVIDHNTTEVDVVNDAAHTNIYQYTIPANTMGATGGFRCTIGGDCLVNAAGTIVLRVYLGATKVFESNAFDITDVASRWWWQWNILCQNAATGSQKWTTSLVASAAGGATMGLQLSSSAWNFVGSGFNSSAEDTTGALSFRATVDWSVASASLSWRKEQALLELLPME